MQAVLEDFMVFPMAVVSWGLDRIDQRDLPLDGKEYEGGGEGSVVFVFDTGIRATHQEFSNGRAYTSADWDWGSDEGNDCQGHGTHVAGTVAGSTVGVAPGADVVGVRVLWGCPPDVDLPICNTECPGVGPQSDIIKGLDKVAAACPGGSVSSDELPDSFQGKKCVANASLGGPYPDDETRKRYNELVDNFRDKGIPIAVAAGNDNTDACVYSPASAEKALTVSSSTEEDARSDFSNFGACVDLFAPGSAINSAAHTSDTSYVTFQGTSMACKLSAVVESVDVFCNVSNLKTNNHRSPSRCWRPCQHTRK